MTAGQTFILGYTNETENIYHKNLPVLIFDDFTTAIKYVDFPFKVKSSAMKILSNDKSKTSIKYLFYAMGRISIDTELHKRYWISLYSNISIPLPPLSVQLQIVQKLDKVQLLIEQRKYQIEKLDLLAKSRFIEMFGDPELNTKKFSEEKLENLFRIGSSKRILQSEQVLQGVPFLRISDLMQRIEGKQNTVTLFVSEAMFAQLQKDGLVPKSGDILITSRGTLGRCYVIQPDDRFYFQDGMISWLSERNSAITNTYLVYWFQMPRFRKQMAKMLAGSTVAYLSIAMLKKIQVPLPPLALQNEFAAFIEQLDKSKFSVSQQQKMIDSCKRGIILHLTGRL